MSIQQKYGQRVKEIRLLKGFSQEMLAEKSNLHRTYISSVELGNRNISIQNIQKIAIALDCDITEFFNIN